jgi:hypothetical protein
MRQCSSISGRSLNRVQSLHNPVAATDSTISPPLHKLGSLANSSYIHAYLCHDLSEMNRKVLPFAEFHRAHGGSTPYGPHCPKPFKTIHPNHNEVNHIRTKAISA